MTKDRFPDKPAINTGTNMTPASKLRGMIQVQHNAAYKSQTVRRVHIKSQIPYMYHKTIETNSKTHAQTTSIIYT